MKSSIPKWFQSGAFMCGLLLPSGWQHCAASPSTVPAAAETVRDADGNIYCTVKIGDQVWTVENLRTSKFNDGTPIPQVTDPGEWKNLNTAAFCYYENKPDHGKTYGLLYNWHAASSEKIAPKGWRVPTIEEQFVLRDYLVANGFNYDGTKDGNKVAKAMATRTEWPYLEKDAYGNAVPDLAGMIGNKPETNNKSGFSARPSGCRWSDGSFHASETSVYWWSATPHDATHARHTSLHTWFSKFGDNHHHKRTGFSIRLIRDDDKSGGGTRQCCPINLIHRSSKHQTATITNMNTQTTYPSTRSNPGVSSRVPPGKAVASALALRTAATLAILSLSPVPVRADAPKGGIADTVQDADGNIYHTVTKHCLSILAMSFLLAAAPVATAAPFEIEGPIKEVKKIETKPPYTFDDKPVMSVNIVGHRFGKDFDYKYMVVEGVTELNGISFSELKPGRYVRIKSRAEPPGMVGKPINEIRASRYGLCNFALHMDTVATPKNLTATITRVDLFGAGEVVITVRENADAPEFKYAVADGKTTIKNGVLADLKVSATIDIAHASINVPVPEGKDHGKLHGADLFAREVTFLKGPHLMTVAGPIDAASAGLALTHEHVLVDFIGADKSGPHRYDPNKVFAKVLPHLARANELGARLFVECTPEFLGRDPKLLRRFSEAAKLHILTNTGLYGARNGKFLPPYAANETAEQLATRWITEARDGIEGTGIRPGFIKCGVNTDAELSPVDRKIVEAAALAHRATGLTIAVHTGAGPGLAQIDILKSKGVAPAAWIWVHAQSAGNAEILAAAKQGAWLSFDGLRPETLERHLELCKLLRDEKRLGQVLLSHDAGWYDPDKPEGGTFRDFQVMFTQFLPMLKQAGFTEAAIHELATENPARAFSVGPRLLSNQRP